ncbi:SEC-C domain-containing protein [Patescibacteria group bacterium]|nr:SEC-C domain-containing protein [Patescibacteria group bacterium]
MLFSVDNVQKSIVATIQKVNWTEKYECIISACENPVCTCGNVYLELIPMQLDDNFKEHSHHRKIEIDIDKKALGYKNQKKIPKEDLEFSKLFLDKLNEDDFQFLYKSHFEYKNKISEKASPDTIDGYFDYHEIEYNGLMSAYNDILPYGDQFLVTINGEQCIIFDQYCLLPKCSCTDTNLDIISIDKLGKKGKELCFVALNYRKKRWKLVDESSFSISLETVRTAVEEQIPDIYKQMHKRHIKLKAIYAHCKKKNYAPTQELQFLKASRNDPCPCGSGKKYKKCCLR